MGQTEGAVPTMGFELKIPYGLPYEDNVLELQRSSE